MIRRALLGLAILLAGSAQADPDLSRLKLPAGFHIEIYAHAPGARHMALGKDGTVYVGTIGEGVVYAIPDANHDHKADEVITLARGLNHPNGVTVDGDDLYVAEIQRILRYPGVARKLKDPPHPTEVARLPDKQWHGNRILRLGPDGLLYVGIGVPSNIMEVDDPFGTILRMKTDGSGREVYCRGQRDTVGIDWDAHKELWFSDNGRDYLGDNLPPEEINHAPHPGMHFGFPYVYGQNVPDPKFPKAPAGLKFTPPALELEAHCAPLGMRFYHGAMFPKEYQGRLLVANHGSWNRSTPIGYRVMALQVNPPQKKEVLAQGWLQQNGRYFGRPVDVEVLDDGSVLVSDDHAGVIYRITYRK